MILFNIGLLKTHAIGYYNGLDCANGIRLVWPFG